MDDGLSAVTVSPAVDQALGLSFVRVYTLTDKNDIEYVCNMRFCHTAS